MIPVAEKSVENAQSPDQDLSRSSFPSLRSIAIAGVALLPLIGLAGCDTAPQVDQDQRAAAPNQIDPTDNTGGITILHNGKPGIDLGGGIGMGFDGKIGISLY